MDHKQRRSVYYDANSAELYASTADDLGGVKNRFKGGQQNFLRVAAKIGG
jgi:hypothetical protein